MRLINWNLGLLAASDSESKKNNVLLVMSWWLHGSCIFGGNKFKTFWKLVNGEIKKKGEHQFIITKNRQEMERTLNLEKFVILKFFL